MIFRMFNTLCNSFSFDLNYLCIKPPVVICPRSLNHFSVNEIRISDKIGDCLKDIFGYTVEQLNSTTSIQLTPTAVTPLFLDLIPSV